MTRNGTLVKSVGEMDARNAYVKTDAICLSIAPWSRTSHIVIWLTPFGRIGTVVKGAERPKSAFLGQYDLNYTCEIVYYARAKSDLHALRECTPTERRDALRDDYAALALAGYFRFLADRFAPQGPDCAAWYEALGDALDLLAGREESAAAEPEDSISLLLRYELRTLRLLGLDPEIEAEAGAFALRGERQIPIAPEVAEFIRDLTRQECRGSSDLTRQDCRGSSGVALDAVRVLGVYYNFHVDGVSDVRRAVLGLVYNKARHNR